MKPLTFAWFLALAAIALSAALVACGFGDNDADPYGQCGDGVQV